MADDFLHELRLKVALLEQSVAHLKKDFDDQVEKFVTHDQFYSVRLLTHGLAGLILTGVVGALIASVIK
jgi:hypothetical protein